MTADLDDVRFRIAAARRMLARGGCESAVGGHVSVRHPDEDSFWVTPFEYFDETLPSHVIRSTFSLEALEGAWTPSPAIQFHVDIYRRRPDVGAIVHTHSEAVRVVTTTGREVGIFCTEACLFLDDQTTYRDDGRGAQVNAAILADALGDRNVLLMRHHGAVVVGSTLEVATVKSMVLERCARAHLDAVVVDGVEMDVEEAALRKPQFERYFLPEMWDANLRRLHRSDPDLFQAP